MMSCTGFPYILVQAGRYRMTKEVLHASLKEETTTCQNHDLPDVEPRSTSHHPHRRISCCNSPLHPHHRSAEGKLSRCPSQYAHERWWRQTEERSSLHKSRWKGPRKLHNGRVCIARRPLISSILDIYKNPIQTITKCLPKNTVHTVSTHLEFRDLPLTLASTHCQNSL